jgi:D-alanine-D-alanine ligase
MSDGFLKQDTRARAAGVDVTVLLGDPRLSDATKVAAHFSAEDLEAVRRMKEALGGLEGHRFSYLDDHETLLAELTARRPDFVLNFCDTGYRNVAARELHVCALLELLDLPYSGSGPACLALCYDKALVRALALYHGIPVPNEAFLGADAPPSALPSSFPALIKPNRGDGSVGITQHAVVHDHAEAEHYVAELRRTLPGQAVLVQEYLEGPEYGVALIGNPADGLEALSLLEVDYRGLPAGLPPILSYESKTIPDSPYWTDIKFHEARLDESTRATLVQRAALMFERLGCRDYARFDFRADASGTIKLLEVNANPAWCWDGKLAFMAGFAGIDYAGLLERIVTTALRRTGLAAQ